MSVNWIYRVRNTLTGNSNSSNFVFLTKSWSLIKNQYYYYLYMYIHYNLSLAKLTKWCLLAPIVFDTKIDQLTIILSFLFINLFVYYFLNILTNSVDDQGMGLVRGETCNNKSLILDATLTSLFVTTVSWILSHRVSAISINIEIKGVD